MAEQAGHLDTGTVVRDRESSGRGDGWETPSRESAWPPASRMESRIDLRLRIRIWGRHEYGCGGGSETRGPMGREPAQGRRSARPAVRGSSRTGASRWPHPAMYQSRLGARELAVRRGDGDAVREPWLTLVLGKW